MASVNASVWPPLLNQPSPRLRTFLAISGAGFRRYATYRQASVAGAFTNIVFGFLRCYLLLAVAGAAAGGRVGGYGQTQLATFVWAGQGLLAVVLPWGWTELAERVRTGDVVGDLLRPVAPVSSYLATDLGRAGYALLARFLPVVLVGPMVFAVHLPHRWPTVPLFAVSVLLAVVICFGCRYLVNATAYWLHDIRGSMILWTLLSGLGAGLYFPLRFLPTAVLVPLWLFTPLPSILQAPLDVLVERDPAPVQFGLVGIQAIWAAVILLACRVVQRRAERRLVVQGG